MKRSSGDVLHVPQASSVWVWRKEESSGGCVVGKSMEEECTKKARASTPLKAKESELVVISDDDEGGGGSSIKKVFVKEEHQEAPSEPDFRVELLDAGTLPHARWCTRDSIFPAGFKSRVRYYNFLDLPGLTYYVCEIVDCGADEPCFKVTLQHLPEHCFIAQSAHLCWRSVQHRLNFEIQRKRKLGKFDVPPIQDAEKMDGLRMFGLSHPSIKEVVERLDPKHACGDYWNEPSLDDTLSELFKKGSPSELWALHNVLTDSHGSHEWKKGFSALGDALQLLLEANVSM